MKNKGKVFEENFKKSIDLEDDIIYYRLIDNASSYYGGNEQLRFSPKNVADNIVFYTHKEQSQLFFIELKSTKGKSIPLGNIKKNEKDKRIDTLYDFAMKTNVNCLLIVFFSDIEECYALKIGDLIHFIATNDRKSIPLDYFKETGFKIGLKRLKTNYKYEVMELFRKFY